MKFLKKPLTILLVFLVLFGCFTFLQFGFVPSVYASGEGWLSGGWAKRVKFTIDAGDIDTADLTNFPVLLHLSNSSSGYNAEDVSFIFDELTADANRLKIAVTTSGGTTECYVEIERWSDAAEMAWLWVKVPTVEYDVNTDLYLYYDSTHADNTAYVGDIESAAALNVWDANYLAVYHLPDKTTSSVADSSTNNRDGTKLSANTPIEDVGKIDKGQAFTSDSITLTNMQNKPEGTIEAFCYPTNSATGRAIVSDTGYGAFIFTVYPANYWGFTVWDTQADWCKSSGTITLNAWTHVVGTYKTGEKRKLYINGTLDFTSAANFTGLIGNPNPLVMGYWSYVGGSYWWAGVLDEIRISSIQRTAEWIKATYESGRDQLLDWGSEETSGDTAKPTYSGISTNATIRNTVCNFSVTLADETALKNYTFGCNNTGTWTNDSVVTISGTSYKANTTYTLNGTVGYVVQWEYWFADSSNNLNNTGVLGNTTTGNALAETASASINPSLTPSRVSLAVRSAQNILQILASVSRALSFPRSNSLNVPCSILASRSLVLGRTSPLSPLINAISSVAQALQRSASQLLSVDSTTTRTLTTLRTTSLTVLPSLSALRVAVYGRTSGMNVFASAAASRTLLVSRSLIQTISEAFSASRTQVLGRSSSQSIIPILSVVRLQGFSRTVDLTMWVTAVSQRLEALGRGASQHFAPSSSATRTVVLFRQTSLNINVFMSAIRGGVFSFNPSLSFAVFASPDRVLSLSRANGLNIAAYLAAVRSQDLTRSVSQGFYKFFQAFRTMGFARNINLNAVFSLSGSRSQTLARAVSQSVSESFQALRAIGFIRNADLAVNTLFSVNIATSGIHSFFVNIALSLGITASPQRSTTLGRASSMLLAPSFLPTQVTGPYVIGGGVVGTTVETPMYKITVTQFSVGQNLVQNRLFVDSQVKVESLNGYSGSVVLAYRLIDSKGTVLDSENKTVEVMGGSSATVPETLSTSYFWDAVGNDDMTFTLTATWQATNQTAPQVITSSFIPCPIVTGLRQYQYYLYLSLGLCAFGAILFYDEPRKRKKS